MVLAVCQECPSVFSQQYKDPKADTKEIVSLICRGLKLMLSHYHAPPQQCWVTVTKASHRSHVPLAFHCALLSQNREAYVLPLLRDVSGGL